MQAAGPVPDESNQADVSHIAQTRPGVEQYRWEIMSEPIRDCFDHALVIEDDGRVRIKSTCKACDFSGIVSVADGSLMNWKTQHVCGHVRPFSSRLPNNGPQLC